MERMSEGLEGLLAPLRSDRLELAEGYDIPPKHRHDDVFVTKRQSTYRNKKIEIQE